MINTLTKEKRNELTIIRYYQYADFIYNDGQGNEDKKINDVVADMFDDDKQHLAELINTGSSKSDQTLIYLLPEYYSIERFY